MSKQFWAVIAAIVIVFVGIFTLTGDKNESKSTDKTLTNHVTGSTSSGVKLTEYGDFQCPYCELYYPTVKSVLAEYEDKIQFQFRNYPLTNAHPNAFSAARAAEAAGLQDKFWEMYDALYTSSNNQVWTTAQDPTKNFEAYAQGIGLDLAKYRTDFASTKVNDLVNNDLAEGNRVGVTGTPSFFINGKAVQINNDVASFRKVLDKAIADEAKKKGSTPAPAAEAPAAGTTEQTPTTETTQQTTTAQ